MTKQTKGKIASLIILLITGVPIIYSFADFYWTSVKGVQDDTRKSGLIGVPNPFGTIQITNPLDYFGTTSNVTIQKNEDLILLDKKTPSTVTKNEIPKSTPEGGGNQLIPSYNTPFKTKIFVKNQQPEAVGNNFLHMKNSYDLTINKNTTTVFISAIDPRLVEDRSISINYDLAKRLGLEPKEGTYEASAIRKK